jgi:hypothetical protein
MKVVLKVEKSGQVIAQSEFEVNKEKGLLKGSRKAFAQLQEEHPDLGLFDNDVRIKFEKIQ